MARKDELATLADSYAKKYGRLGTEFGFEFLALHTIAMEPEFADEILSGQSTENVDLSEFHTGRSKDLQIDGILQSQDSTQIAIIQTAYSASKGIDENRRNKIKAFFDNYQNWLDEDYVRANGNSKISSLLMDSSIGAKGQKIKLYFFTSFSLLGEDDLFDHAKRRTAEYSIKGVDVECVIVDGSRFLKMYEELKSGHSQSVVKTVSFKVSDEFTFIHNDALVTAIKGNELSNIFNTPGVGVNLFNSNIRLALRQTKINNKIKETTQSEEAPNFFIYNNGVTATCSEFSYDKGRVTAENVQVVNGAQTVYSLQHLSRQPNDKVYVLLRLIETSQFGKKKSETADKITRYQNTQNPVKLPDFKSNDPIQLWLRDNLSNSLSGKGANIEFWYCHKRGYEPTNTPGQRITSEDLAKMRHAFLHGPRVAYKEPKTIWDETDNDARYWEAFGSDDKRCQVWSAEELAQVGWALRTRSEVRKIKSDMKKQTANEETPPRELRYLESFSVYIMALVAAGVKIKQQLNLAPSFTEIMATEPNYQKYTKDLITFVRSLVRIEVENSEGVNIRQELPSSESTNRRLINQIENEVSSSRFN
jgi:AIPR protein